MGANSDDIPVRATPMPYTGNFTDHFNARCQAAVDDRCMPKVGDLLRLGPYRSDSWRRDVVTFSLWLARRIKGRPFPVGVLLRDELHEIARDPSRRSVLYARNQLASSENSRNLPPALHQAACLRLDCYLATAGDEKATERVILRCMRLAVAAQTTEIRIDYTRAAFGWSVLLKQIGSPEPIAPYHDQVWRAGQDVLAKLGATSIVAAKTHQ